MTNANLKTKILLTTTLLALALLAAPTLAAPIVLTLGDLQGGAAWDTDDVGLAGKEVTLDLLAEETPHANLNVFYFDTQQDGWGGGLDTLTNDTVVFSAGDGVGASVTGLLVGSDWNLSLLNDLNDDNELSFNDAYLNSESNENYTPNYAAQYIKYYVANPGIEYEFGGAFLGDGHQLLIFIDDDHTAPNFDYNDMIIGATITGIPEPMTMVLLTVGAAGMLSRRRRK